jgi:signal transduction histidine kinase
MTQQKMRIRERKLIRIHRLQRELDQRRIDLKAMEESLQVALAEAAEADCVKTAFLCNVSHELRTPVSGILGMTELLLDDPTCAPNLREMLEAIEESADALLALINQILLFLRIEGGGFRVVSDEINCVDLIENCGQAFARAFDRHDMILMMHVRPGTPANLRGPVAVLENVLLNLLSNAIKFGEHGAIFVSAAVITAQQTRHLRMTVEDHGVGINAEAREVLFAAFAQGDSSSTRRFGGLGLGLAVAERLVGLVGGSIDFEPSPQGGAKFWFEVPIDSPE